MTSHHYMCDSCGATITGSHNYKKVWEQDEDGRWVVKWLCSRCTDIFFGPDKDLDDDKDNKDKKDKHDERDKTKDQNTEDKNQEKDNTTTKD